MILNYLDTWLLFAVSFGALLLVTIVMARQAKQFYTLDPVKRRFSIMELELPATSLELQNIIKGIFALPADDSLKSKRAVKRQLLLDFIFMPLAYGSIFLLCFRVSQKMELTLGRNVFMFFAWAQLVAWVCDIIENIYLLNKLNEGINVSQSSTAKHKEYLVMEVLKWGLSLVATSISLSAIAYFWITGAYSTESLKYAGIAMLELLAFLLLIRKVG